MPDESKGAMVRWRPGYFLDLNDIAYAHGGRIVIPSTRGYDRSSSTFGGRRSGYTNNA
jgi:hypothetical protein